MAKIIETLPMVDDAAGLAGFITQATAALPKENGIGRHVLYVRDQHDNSITEARIRETILTDGSRVYDLILTVDA